MFQPAGDLRLQNKAGPAVRIVGVLVLDLLEGDFAVQFLVVGHEDLAEPAAGMRPENAKTQPDDVGVPTERAQVA